MNCMLLALLPALIAASSLEDIADVNKGSGRQGKLFFVSSSSTTSTVSTATYCWTTGTTAVTSSCRRKRSLIRRKEAFLDNDQGNMKNLALREFHKLHFVIHFLEDEEETMIQASQSSAAELESGKSETESDR